MARARRRRGWYDAFMDVGIWILFVLLLVPAAFVGYVIGKDQDDDEPATQASGTVQQGEAIADGNSINAAPAFTAENLMEEPRDAWVTNGGTLMNQRYSPLDEIDTGNVADLKGVWMTDLAGSGVAGKYSAEGQPIVYEGVMYVPTGADDVFAVSIETGKILWRYEAKLDQKISTVCCGWLSRGVALGEGKVYLGQLDGTLVALDQQTGQRVWQTAVGDWQKGYTITAAPLYYDGMVITGVSGGEFSIRGRVQAYDAKTGKEVWRFYTIPGPGEKGHDTWPQDNDSWKHGGAPVWQTPAVDPELGLLYFSTGNASPDLDGSRRQGDNLFAASIVAVDAKTGKYRWHFQQVHHDIWDYDGPSPVVLFDVEIDGEEHKGIAEASKTGWLYLLDRESGKPLLPIEEKAVPQLASQATAKTQPIPSYPPFFSHDVSDADVAAIQKLATANAKGGAKPKVTKGRIFTPFGESITAIVPGPQGGTNWQPTSYNPDTGMFYVCAMRSVSGYSSKNEELPAGKRGETADLGSVFTTTGFGSQEGHFLAIEASTGEIKWQKRWPESCYAGSVTTGGNLVFVGRNNGELQAYNAETGEGPLWSFQTGAGANTTATVFEYDGTQHLAFLAGGNALAATPHGDNLWLFSLDGTMDEAAPPGEEGEGTGHAGQNPNEPTDETEGDAQAGEAVWSDNCAGCHGTSGTGANGGPNLVGNATALDPEKVHAQVTNGGGGMPAFKDTLTAKQISDVTAYVTEEIAKK
jgi:quinohemoprotein ethanol dehydrogenase